MSDISAPEKNSESTDNENNIPNIINHRKNEIIGILITAWGFLSIFALFTNKTGIIGSMISNLFFYIFGQGAYLIPLFLIIWGFYLIRFKSLKLNTRLFGFIFSFIITLALIHTYQFPDFTFRYGLLGKGGGVIGGSISWLLLEFFAEIGTYIVLLAFLLIGLLLWSNIMLKSIFNKIEKLLKNFFSAINEKRKCKNERDEKKDMKVNMNSAGEIAAADKRNSEFENEGGLIGVEQFDFYDLPVVDSDNENETLAKEDGDKEEKKHLSDHKKSENKEGDFNNHSETIETFYSLPALKLLEKSPRKKVKLNNKTELLEETLQSFGVDAKVIDVNHGPTITRYEIQPAAGVKVSKIVNLANDIALALAAPDVRIEAPIPGKAAVGIEVPHSGNITVRLRDIIGSKNFKKPESKLTMALGQGIDGDPVITDLSKMPHLLIAGATGSGKSVCINTLITSFLYKTTPEDLKLILVDPKKVELSNYKGLPHLFTPVVTDPQKASNVLKLVVKEMEDRYDLFSESGTRGIASYNKQADEDEKIPYIVVIIDELSDLMMVAANEVEDNICRLAQMSRAAGIHLIIATQRPSVDVITGLIKANIPSRLSFAVSSQTDSRTILDMGGAEKLLGEGDMLFAPVDASKPKRIQGAFMSDQEINRIVDFIKNQAEAEYEVETEDIQEVELSLDDDKDELYEEAVKLVVNYRASISMLQRRLHIGHSRAARMIDTMEEEGVVGPYVGSKPREVLIDKEELDVYLNDDKSSEDDGDEKVENDEDVEVEQ